MTGELAEDTLESIASPQGSTASPSPSPESPSTSSSSAAELPSTSSPSSSPTPDSVVSTSSSSGSASVAPPPTLTAITPTNGKLAGGFTLTLTGSGFQNGALTVKMGGSSGTDCTSVAYVDSTRVTCIAPARSAAIHDVYLLNADGQAVTLTGGFAYNPIPTLASVTPGSGAIAGGTVITLVGTGFLASAQVTVGGNACTGVVLAGSTGLTCTTPAGSAGSVAVRLTNSDTQSVDGTFAYFAPLTLTANAATCVSGQTLNLSAAGGTGGYTYSVVSGNASVNSGSGVLSCGSPSGAVVARVADLRGVTQDLSLTINPVGPTIVLSQSSYSGTKNTALSTISPTVTSEVQQCTVAPALPSGLTINSASCAITGTPTVYTSSTAYSITVSNVTGVAAATFNLAINDVAPTISTSSGSFTKVRNQDMVAITPTLGGSVASVTIAPALPTGVILNGASGAISGTPSVTLAATPYTLTATNNTGQSATANITLQINQILSASVPYNTVAVSNTMNVAAANGLAPYTYSVNNGSISAGGLYTAPSSANTSVITINDSLSNSTTLSVTVNPALAISPSSVNVEVKLAQAFTASDGVPPYTYALTAGTGTLVSNTYTAPTTVGAGTATVVATDAVGNTATASITILPFCNGTKLTNAPFATGAAGTAADPSYICTATQLYAVDDDAGKLAAYYRLGGDINLAGGPGVAIASSASPFSGTLDGQFYTLSNLTVSDSANDYKGLFASITIGGIIQNLQLSSITIIGKTKVGGVAGTSTGTIQKVAVIGTSLIEGSSNVAASDVGGIVGYLNKPGLVDQAKVGASVTVRNNAGTSVESIGGIAGRLDGTATSAGNFATIQNSYSHAQVLSPGFRIGGIAGYLNFGTLKNNYFAGVADDTGGGSNEGGIVGYYLNPGTYTGNFYDSTVCATNCTYAMPAGNRPATTTLMKSVGTYLRLGWDFAGVWTAPTQAFTGQYPALLWESGMSQMPMSFAGGTGTSESPYQISNAAQLQSLMLDPTRWNSGSSFTITSNITLGGIEVAPIGNTTTAFSGTLDGGYHTISGFGITGTADDTNVGLFGNVGVSGVVRNLILSGITIVGNTKVGGIAGSSAGTIQKVAVIGTSLIEGLYNGGISDIGGIAGYLNKPALVDQTKVGANVTVRNNGVSAQAIGGIAGRLDGTATSAGNFATIQNNYSHAQVLSQGQQIGGIVGYLNYGTLKNNYFAGVADDTTGGANEGGIVGYVQNAGAYAGNFYDSTVCATNCAVAGPAGTRPATTTLMKSVGTYLRRGWDFAAVWTAPTQAFTGQYPALLWESGMSQMPITYAGGTGTSESPYQISNAAQLQALMLDPTKWNSGSSFTLTTNITLSGIEVAPIGNTTTAFNGTLDGGFNTISGFGITGTADDTNVGFFGNVGVSGVVRNLILSGITIVGNTKVGGVAGSSTGTIQKVAIIGTSSIDGLSNTTFSDIGGIVGYMNKPGLIEQAKVGASVTVRNNAGTSAEIIGGIAGRLDGSSTGAGNFATIQNSYSHAQVLSPGLRIGGIAGYLSFGTLKNNYFAGVADDTGGGSNEGGIVGYVINAGTYTGNFYDSTVCATNCVSAGPAGTQPATTALMQSVGTFTRVGWDFYSTWTSPGQVFTGQYPVLAWEPGQALISLTLGGGNGTSGTPYLLSSAAHLNVLMTDYTQWNTSNFYLVTADIDMGNAEVGPIGSTGQPFAGTFDGGSRTISNFKITGTTDDTNVGLFGVLASSATVKNLVVSGVTAKGNANVGAIAGTSTGTIQQVGVTGTSVVEGLLNGTTGYTGGIVGYLNKPGLVDRVKVGSNVTVTNAGISAEGIGGIVGKMDGTALSATNFATIQNSYSQAQVLSPGLRIGGIVGHLNFGTLKNNYFAGVADDTNGGSSEGGILGSIVNPGTYSGNFYDSTVCATNCAVAGPPGTRPIVTALMKSVGTYLRTAWDYSTIWTTPGQVFSGQYPVLQWEAGQSALSVTFAGGNGTSGTPYLISNASTLQSLMIDKTKWNNGSYFRVTADIDLAGLEVGPIGSSTTGFSFTGNLDGQNKVISNFAVNGTADDTNVGLFGYIGGGGVVQNLILTNITMKGNSNVGGVAGSSAGTIQKVAMRGTSLIESLANTNAPTGGVVGYLFTPGLVDQVAAVSSVTVQNAGTSAARLGGIVGFADGPNTTAPVISNSYSLGTVTTPGGTSGGIVGYINFSKVSNCYFAGISDDNNGTSNEGGVVGAIQNTPSVLYTYFDSTVCASGSSRCSNGYATGTTALSTTNIQDTAQINAAWDFNNIWLAPGNAYFKLRWEP